MCISAVVSNQFVFVDLYIGEDGDCPPTKVPGSIPKKREEVLNWNGWGFKDSGFELFPPVGDKKSNAVFKGQRYEIGGAELPLFSKWIEEKMKVDLSVPKREFCREPTTFPSPTICEGIYDGIFALCQSAINTFYCGFSFSRRAFTQYYEIC